MSTSDSPVPGESWLELPEGGTFPLKGRCTIGRQADNDLVIDAVVLSRHHALISYENGTFLVSDLHSRNGTYLNRTPVTRPAPLRDGDEILLGTVTLRFRKKRSWFKFEKAPVDLTVTASLDNIQMRDCWLLLLDVVGSTALSTKIGNEAALRQTQAWFSGLRALIEKAGGRINGYFGDAIIAYWPGDSAKPAQMIAALKSIESWRPQSPLPFRMVSHYGTVLFSRSELGEEITGDSVNVLHRSEKIAKGFGASAMVSQSVVDTLGLTGKCESFGRSSIDGMKEYFIFYALPEEWTPKS